MRMMLGCWIGAFAMACRPSPASLQLTEADRSAMRAQYDSFTVRVVAHRDSAAASIYEDNAKLLPPNHPIVEGRAGIRNFIATFPPLTSFTATPQEIEGRGDLAYVRGVYHMTFPAAGGRPAMEDRGKFLEIRHKQQDGTWLIVVDMFNSDLAPPK